LIQAGIINGEQVQTSSGKTFNVDSQSSSLLSEGIANGQTQQQEKSSEHARK